MITEGVHADLDTTHLKDSVTTSAVETVKSLPALCPADWETCTLSTTVL
jgi:hypothetical protein